MDNSNGEPGVNTAPADAARRVQDAARTAIDATRNVAEEKIEAGADRAVTSMQTAADTLRRAAGDVEGDQAWLGVALRKSAEGLETAVQSMSGGDIHRALNDLTGFARRQPAMFLGASLALGFALARVGKTAIEQSGESANAMPRSNSSSFPTVV